KRGHGQPRPDTRLLRCLHLSFCSFSLSKPQFSANCHEFLPWLERKADSAVSSSLFIGKSSYGRSLFASKTIQTGDCILKVPYIVQITADNLPPEIKSLIGEEVRNIAKLAIAILIEKKMDFLNHDGLSEAIVMSNGDQKCSEVCRYFEPTL
ncbi:hypothetical protein VIGAN_08008700, partial [Vigna angularis var. angularis]